MSGGHASWLVGGGILVLGAIAALPFYQRAPGASVPQSMSASGSEVHWDGDPLTLRLPGTEPPSSSLEPRSRTSLTPLETSQSGDPPAVDGEYGSLLNRFEGAKSPQQISSDPGLRALSIGALAAGESATYNVERAARETSVEKDSKPLSLADVSDRQVDRDEDDEAVEQSYSIVDGDTLERISQRYYGDPFYAKAIYDRNRGILSDPALLPVGQRIMIPPKQAVTSVQKLPLEPINESEQPQGQLESIP